MPIFTSNYPHFQSGAVTLLSTPERTGALPEYTGRGVVIAFIDSGFYTHPDLEGRILAHVNASTRHLIEERTVISTDDLSWHGQMTSVIAAGDGTISNGKYRAIASGAQVVLIKITSPRGQIKEADILRGLRWLNDTYRRFNIRVVNISVGGDFVSNDPDHPIHLAISKLVANGVTVLVAAGNKGQNSLVPPASSPHAITVGGYNDHNSPDRSLWTAYHNNYGTVYDGSAKPEILAASDWIASPILPGSVMAREAQWLAPLLLEAQPNGALKNLLANGYGDLGFTHEQVGTPDDKLYQMIQQRINSHKLIDAHHQHVDGTSVSTAVASSIVAQMIEANPRLTPAQVKAILKETAKPLSNVPAEKQGAGVIDPSAAVKIALKT
jgi:serine protease AprX